MATRSTGCMNNSLFQFFDTPFNYAQPRDFLVSINGVLATIPVAKTNQLLNELSGDSQSICFGLATPDFRIRIDPAYSRFEDGSKLEYDFGLNGGRDSWSAKVPSSSSLFKEVGCVRLDENDRWFSTICATTIAFICEFECTLTSTTSPSQLPTNGPVNPFMNPTADLTGLPRFTPIPMSTLKPTISPIVTSTKSPTVAEISSSREDDSNTFIIISVFLTLMINL